MPAIVLIYVYSVIGLYAFHGKIVFIQILSLPNAEIQIISIKYQIGQYINMKYFFVVKDNAQLLMELSISA